MQSSECLGILKVWEMKTLFLYKRGVSEIWLGGGGVIHLLQDKLDHMEQMKKEKTKMANGQNQSQHQLGKNS